MEESDWVSRLSIFSLISFLSYCSHTTFKSIQTQHFDEQHQQHYWYNRITGVSQWNEDNEPPSSASPKTIKEQSIKYAKLIKSATRDQNTALATADQRALVASQQSNQDYSDEDEVEDEDGMGMYRLPTITDENNGNKRIKNGKGKKKKRKKDTSSINDSDDSTALLTTDKSSLDQKNDVPFKTSLAIQVHASTQRDICFYSVCIFINAIIIEGPFAATEAYIRSSLFLLSFLLVCIPYVVTRYRWLYQLGSILLREFLLSFAAALSLSIPLMSCFVYRKYRMDSDWELSSVPTLLGWVDSRRFASFTYGNGSFANNVRYDHILRNTEAADEDDENDVENQDTADIDINIQQKDSSRDQQRHQRHINRNCQDTWKGTIMLEPRRVHINLVLIVRGDDPLGILQDG